jgi:catechol 2,3-dioxygenase
MTTDPLDIEGILAELAGHPEPWSGLPAQTVLGHMHLHVADIAEAEAFYGQVLGFELTTRYGANASFVSAGGYHHHIAFNTWAGRGAPPPPPDAVGLRYFTINLPNQAELDRVAERIKQAGIEVKEREGALLVHDPSRNGLVLVAGHRPEVVAELAAVI